MQSSIPTAIATYRTGDTEVSLYRVDDDYRFTVTVQREQASVGYRSGRNAKLRFTVFEGDPAFFRNLSMTQFHNVELGVWHCMRLVKHQAIPPTSAEPQP
ncbi:hypothetical protein [Trinickia dabaoshanensis]|nr:hypothetical protein [Trinickia dabaoshanensis]